MPREIELKARVADREALRVRLRDGGADLALPRALEDNFLLDDAASSLRRQGQALRVRFVHGRAVLTWKGPRTMAAGIKSREELETGCDDGHTLLAILAGLGFAPVFRYQKYRETWRLEGVQVLVDETPAGDFLEIEGTTESVRRAQERLGVAAADVVEESYPALFQRLLEQRGDRSRAMVFVEPG